ncbi:endonuclease-reverse transcriptase [Plakobranchus ocellatus]|uniref:Endonuclease-reverse transcriptase n=1 Tax=Plakobranchus ocellatus TaxID=259542 RepID=A0AAV3ZWW2_9GAST|nr:endonuclease-reverse transcriptase [Plakobranchus ocellatus]
MNEPICTFFQDACNRLDDKTEKDAAMQEASAIRFDPQLRLAFTTILIYCRPADPLAFWYKHNLELCRDIMVRDKVTELNPQTENQVLMELQDKK